MAQGGARPGAGRPKGVPNKVNQDLRAMAQQYTTDALNALVDIVRNGDSHAAKVSAAKELLDRAHGKASQHVELDADIKSDVMVTAINLIGKKERD